MTYQHHDNIFIGLLISDPVSVQTILHLILVEPANRSMVSLNEEQSMFQLPHVFCFPT